MCIYCVLLSSVRAVVLDGKARERRDLFASGCGKFLLYELVTVSTSVSANTLVTR